MKDNFSTQAGLYAQFRPSYPKEMIDYVVSQVADKETALDVATGNGQVAGALSEHFKKVFATDISQKQLDNAIKKDNIVYRVSAAENTDFDANTFDLITVAQAIHWFDFDVFYKEIHRILKPNGVFAVLGYGLLYTNAGADRILHDFYTNIVGPYWDPERKYLDENYTTIPFPFEEQETPKFVNELTWDFEQLTGYLETWSAVQHYIKQHNSNPIDLIREALREAWQKGDKKVYFPLLLRIGKPKQTTL